jgi:hypothetical protein
VRREDIESGSTLFVADGKRRQFLVQADAKRRTFIILCAQGRPRKQSARCRD